MGPGGGWRSDTPSLALPVVKGAEVVASEETTGEEEMAAPTAVVSPHQKRAQGLPGCAASRRSAGSWANHLRGKYSVKLEGAVKCGSGDQHE